MRDRNPDNIKRHARKEEAAGRTAHREIRASEEGCAALVAGFGNEGLGHQRAVGRSLGTVDEEGEGQRPGSHLRHIPLEVALAVGRVHRHYPVIIKFSSNYPSFGIWITISIARYLVGLDDVLWKAIDILQGWCFGENCGAAIALFDC
mgnify:CR=1 FL=1